MRFLVTLFTLAISTAFGGVVDLYEKRANDASITYFGSDDCTGDSKSTWTGQAGVCQTDADGSSFQQSCGIGNTFFTKYAGPNCVATPLTVKMAATGCIRTSTSISGAKSMHFECSPTASLIAPSGYASLVFSGSLTAETDQPRSVLIMKSGACQAAPGRPYKIVCRADGTRADLIAYAGNDPGCKGNVVSSTSVQRDEIMLSSKGATSYTIRCTA